MPPFILAERSDFFKRKVMPPVLCFLIRDVPALFVLQLQEAAAAYTRWMQMRYLSDGQLLL